MKKKIAIPVAVAAVAAAATIGITTAFAYTGNEGMGKMGFGPWGEDQEEMAKAIDEGNYDAWREMVSNKADEFASEENFNNLQALHTLMSEGKYDEARELREELDMPIGPRGHHGEEMSAVREAVESGDYDAWKIAMEDKVVNRLSDIESKINEDTFNRLVEAHNAMESGDVEKARQIREDLGFPAGKGMHEGGFGPFGPRHK